jgi:hypothetical protein
VSAGCRGRESRGCTHRCKSCGEGCGLAHLSVSVTTRLRSTQPAGGQLTTTLLLLLSSLQEGDLKYMVVFGSAMSALYTAGWGANL